MPKTQHILLVGNSQLSIIYPFVTELKAANRDLKFSVINPYHVSGKIDSKLLEPFDRIYKLEEGLNYRLSVMQLISFLSHKNNLIRYTKAVVKGLLTLHLKKEMDFILSKYKYKLYWTKEIRHYDLIHHQALFDPKIELMDVAKSESKKIMISFWGSDLLNTKANNIIERQRIALSMADVVTTQTNEMRDVVNQKFGENIAKKTSSVLFGIPDKELNTILSFKKNKEITIKEFIIQVGYNSSPAQNHVKILQSLSELSSELKTKISLVIPMGYGNRDEKYIAEVKLLALKYFKKVEVNTSYLTRSEYLEKFSKVDIYLNLPETDAGNSTIYEALLLGSNIIVGSWLPYSEFKKNGIELNTVTEFSEIASSITKTLSLNSDRKINEYADKTYQMIAYSRTSVKWNEIYKNLFN